MKTPPSEKHNVWTTAPERRFSDTAAPESPRGAEQVRDAIQAGLATIAAGGTPVLLPPSPKAYSPKRAGKDLTCHRYLEIGIVVQGEMVLWWDGVATACPNGTVFVIPPGTRYLPHLCDETKPTPAHSVVWLALHRGCMVAHRCHFEGKIHRVSEYYRFTEPQITGMTRSIAQEVANRSPYHADIVRGLLLSLFGWLLRAPVSPVAPRTTAVETKNSPLFHERVKNYLHANYHHPVTLTQIARAMGCSNAYLCRQFRAHTGQTPFHFLRDVRMAAAKNLLLSEVPIGRVAEMVGFEDPLYFSKVFTRQFALSPQRYRASAK